MQVLSHPKESAMTQFIDEWTRLLDDTPTGDMGCAPYEVAWVARVRRPGTDTPAFPALLELVRKTQQEDGGWGPDVGHVTSRISATLASVLSLSDAVGQEAQAQIQRGLRFLASAWPRRNDDRNASAGFEMLAPTLIDECARSGLQWPGIEAALEAAHKRAAPKLALFPRELMYRSDLATGHFLESLRNELDPNLARATQLSDGSIQGSPSATAFFAMRTADDRAFRYLKRMVDEVGGNFGCEYPTDVMERVYILWNARLAGMTDVLKSAMAPHVDHIVKHFGPRGIGYATQNPLVDPDDTALALLAMHAAGLTIDASVLQNFDSGEHFLTFLFETTPSPVVNARVLEALHIFDYPNSTAVLERLVKFLRSTRADDGLWHDKYHISPFYPTVGAVFALAPIEGSSTWLRETIEAIERTQRSDGGWGCTGESTPEETAYCIQALLVYGRTGEQFSSDCVRKGVRFLRSRLHDDNPRALWVSKGLYCPRQIIRSTVLCALNMSAADGFV
jgi:hypothetical protein